MSSIETIADRCKNNDRQAQAELYQLLAPKLLGVCVRYMQDRDEAEDVMQDAFVKIFTSIKSFKADGSFEGWARRITVNTALSALKKRGRILFERNLELVENTEFSEEEEELVDLDQVTACINALAPGYRTIINLFLIEEFSHKEIAEKLSISESTSRSQCARARQALMKLLKEKLKPSVTKNA